MFNRKSLTALLITSAILVAGANAQVPNAGQPMVPSGGGAGASGTASGDLSGTYPSPTVSKINGLPLVNPTSWTPTDASGGGLTFTSVSANYVRIGNMVFAYATLTYPSTADGNSATLGGLPVTTANAGYAKQCSLTLSSSANGQRLQPVQNSTSIAVLTTQGAGVTNAQMSGAVVTFTCIYPAT